MILHHIRCAEQNAKNFFIKNGRLLIAWSNTLSDTLCEHRWGRKFKINEVFTLLAHKSALAECDKNNVVLFVGSSDWVFELWQHADVGLFHYLVKTKPFKRRDRLRYLEKMLIEWVLKPLVQVGLVLDEIYAWSHWFIVFYSVYN